MVARSAWLKAFELIAPATDGVTTQSGDFNQPLDTAVLCSSSQQAHKASATLFIERRQQAIDRTMLFCCFAA